MPLDFYSGLVFTAVAIMSLIRHRHSNAVKGIAVGMGLLVFNLMFFLVMMGVISYFSLLVILIIYYLAGRECEERWHGSSWRWGIWLTIPLIPIVIFFLGSIFTGGFSSEGGIFVGMLLGVITFSYFGGLLLGSIGGYVGAKAVRQEEEISE